MSKDNSNLESPRDIIEKNKARNTRAHNPSVVKNPINNSRGMASNSLAGEEDFDGSFKDADVEANIESPGSTAISGIVYATRNLFLNKWLIITMMGAALFGFVMMIAVVFLIKNTDSLNYASGTYLASEEYRKIYDTVDKVVQEYKTKYGVTVDKYLIISALTAYQGNEMYVDTTDSSAYDTITVDTEGEDGVFSKSVTEMENYVEILAKYQIVTKSSCSLDSSTPRAIASNDDSTNLFNFWTSAASKEKNYDCSGGSGYSLSVDEGRLEDDESGSAFYWNMIDEDFLLEYYSKYFNGVNDEIYESHAADVVEYIYLYAETLETYDTTNTTVAACNGTSFWWPIGSSETQEKNGVLFASGEPVNTTITADFSGNDSVHRGSHGGIDIATGGNPYIIAAKAGTVIYPSDLSQTNNGAGFYCQDGRCMGAGCKSNTCATDSCSNYGGGYGNYVKIEHSDGTYTVYAHMLAGSITVKSGDKVAQGQVIGKMGTSGCSTGEHLHFEVRLSSENKVNPLDYVKKDDPRPGCGDFSLTSTSLTKQEFVTLMRNYCLSSGNSNFCNNFSSNAELVYDVSLQNNVNPELVVVTAGTEQGWGKCDGLYNFWGIGIPNGAGCSAGPQLTSMEAGIKKYAETINAYLEGGSYANSITNRYNERSSAGCDPAGHGLPGTLAGMQSVYSWIGDHRYNPGNWGKGGCVYLNIIYGSDYCSSKITCGSPYSGCPPESKTTTCEQNDYTTWQLKGKVEKRQEIFGL